MKRIGTVILIVAVLILLCACAPQKTHSQIAATTLPVYEFTVRLCSGTQLQVARIISQEISCLHDYTLQVNQVKAIENAELLVISGAGLEDGLLPEDIHCPVVDASLDIEQINAPHKGHAHDHDHEQEHDHSHDKDPHIWLNINNAKIMAQNICNGLSNIYPEHTQVFKTNLASLLQDLDKLEQHARSELSNLQCRKLITFHDGFSYMAQDWDLEILHAIEEESGSEASAKELIHIINLVHENQLPAIFTEKQGSVSAAQIISRETTTPIYTLDMAMSGDSYFTAMYNNIETLKEALG